MPDTLAYASERRDKAQALLERLLSMAVKKSDAPVRYGHRSLRICRILAQSPSKN